MLRNSHRLFVETSRMKRLDDLESSFWALPLESSQDFMTATGKLDPAILDATRICICFENFLKAELILKQLIIHQLSKKHLANAHKYLFYDQEKRPIKVSEIKQAEGYGKKRKILEFKSLKNKTINLSTLISMPGYTSKFRLPKLFFSALSRINDQRNSLHFLTVASSAYDQGVFDELNCLKTIFNERLVNLANNLMVDLNAPDFHRLDYFL
jgi:hypothetical protein